MLIPAARNPEVMFRGAQALSHICPVSREISDL